WPDAEGRLRVHVEAAGGALRAFAPAALPAHEPAFAMTVHKSQGSEFAAVVLVAGGADHALLTRELLYTGVTRAQARAELWIDEALLRAGLARRVRRDGGLADRLRAASGGESRV
ncbi:MAG TPA: ATP-binding domain-containing protein, partial [Mizugakiibacter sp.]